VSKKQTVLIDKDGSRYVMGTEMKGDKEVPCSMPVMHKCGRCDFEWPDVLTPSEVKAMADRMGCPECLEDKVLVNDQVGDVRYVSV
jgi:hypothetical protein